jgi:putative flippase GtrA
MPNQHETEALSNTILLTDPSVCLHTEGVFMPRTKKRIKGRKRRFGIAGILNVIITNLVLQALLTSNTISILLATLISQGVNTSLGYLIYGKIVFEAKGLRDYRPVLRYICLMTGIWLLNTSIIEAGTKAGLSRNVTAAAIIPALAAVSFIAQNKWVFKQ